MATKKRSKDWLKRSRASKKGWATRKAKAKLAKKASNAQKKLKNAQLGVKKKARKPIKRLPKLTGKTPAELEAIIRQQEEQIRVLMLTKDWVNAMPDEFIRADGTIAVQASRARHLGKATNTMRRALKKASKKGWYALRVMAEQFSNALNIPIREIYTLHYSP